MNILSLRYFLKIAEHGSITRAAAELHITQPALTRHVAHLEDQLRVKLLMPHGRGVRLTEPGRLLTTRRSEEHTSDLQSLMRISYAVFCLKTKPNYYTQSHTHTTFSVSKEQQKAKRT